MTGPILFCFDGSPGSQQAMRAAGLVLDRTPPALVLTVWQPIYLRLASVEAFAPLDVPDEAAEDEQELSYATTTAEQGASLAREHGYDATAIVEQTSLGIAQTILAVADREDASVIVCGQRGRGPVRAALLGSVSHAIASQPHRPVLISPESH
jgi:nucleotide-binding universal stress UspA family protein